MRVEYDTRHPMEPGDPQPADPAAERLANALVRAGNSMFGQSQMSPAIQFTVPPPDTEPN